VLLLDVNVVLAAHREDHAHHRSVRAWIDSMLAGRRQFTVPVLVWASFLRLARGRVSASRVGVKAFGPIASASQDDEGNDGEGDDGEGGEGSDPDDNVEPPPAEPGDEDGDNGSGGSGDTCSAASLVPGARVHKAKSSVSSGVLTITKIELVR